MNLIEMILHILNRGFKRDEALLWLTDVCGSVEIRMAIIECLNSEGKIIHSDDAETPVFPLRYLFTRDGNLLTEPIEEATIESMVESGTPIDSETGDDLLWTGQVVDLIPILTDAESRVYLDDEKREKLLANRAKKQDEMKTRLAERKKEKGDI